MRLSDRAFRRVLLTVWIAFAEWRLGAPLAAHARSRSPESQAPRVARLLF
jgi:hypothetical protein